MVFPWRWYLETSSPSSLLFQYVKLVKFRHKQALTKNHRASPTCWLRLPLLTLSFYFGIKCFSPKQACLAHHYSASLPLGFRLSNSDFPRSALPLTRLFLHGSCLNLCYYRLSWRLCKPEQEERNNATRVNLGSLQGKSPYHTISFFKTPLALFGIFIQNSNFSSFYHWIIKKSPYT